jgi:hypothetical protein
MQMSPVKRVLGPPRLARTLQFCPPACKDWSNGFSNAYGTIVNPAFCLDKLSLMGRFPPLQVNIAIPTCLLFLDGCPTICYRPMRGTRPSSYSISTSPWLPYSNACAFQTEDGRNFGDE